jgi:thioesterase domain-containing protein
MYGHSLVLSDLVPEATVAHLAEVIAHDPSLSAGRTLVAFRRHGTRPPLFLVHPIEGDVFVLGPLARLLDPDQPFFGLRARGVDGTERPMQLLEEMAERYLKEVRTIQPAGPYYLGGYSFGATVALEMAQQLVAHGEEVGLVAMLDASPLLTGYVTPELHPRFARHALRYASRAVTGVMDELKLLEPWERRIVVQTSLRDLLHVVARRLKPGMQGPGVLASPPPEDLPRHLRRIWYSLYRDWDFLPEHLQSLWQAHYRSLVAYQPRPYSGHVALFRARRQSYMRTLDPTLGWATLGIPSIEVHTVPGDHLTMLREPNVQVLADQLTESLAAARARAAR